MSALHPQTSRFPPSALTHLRAAARDLLPKGQTLPAAAWERRHRVMLWILWGHVVLLPVFAVYRGHAVWSALWSVAPIALAGVAATLKPPAAARAR